MSTDSLALGYLRGETRFGDRLEEAQAIEHEVASDARLVELEGLHRAVGKGRDSLGVGLSFTL